MEARLAQHVQRALGGEGPAFRLSADAQRLCQRVQRLLSMHLISPEADKDALELACYALQMPMRHPKGLAGKLGQVSLRERAEQAAELLAGMELEDYSELIDRATQILRELPHRQPGSDEAKLLADAVNIEDFGVVGLFQAANHLCRQQGSVELLVDGFLKRQQYGYWEARLKDGFHFEQIRQLARQRLEHAMHVVELLSKEMKEDESS